MPRHYLSCQDITCHAKTLPVMLLGFNINHSPGIELPTSPNTSKDKGGLVDLPNNQSGCLVKVNVSSTPPYSSQSSLCYHIDPNLNPSVTESQVIKTLLPVTLATVGIASFMTWSSHAVETQTICNWRWRYIK